MEAAEGTDAFAPAGRGSGGKTLSDAEIDALASYYSGSIPGKK
jgi:hypothetical protein